MDAVIDDEKHKTGLLEVDEGYENAEKMDKEGEEKRDQDKRKVGQVAAGVCSSETTQAATASTRGNLAATSLNHKLAEASLSHAHASAGGPQQVLNSPPYPLRHVSREHLMGLSLVTYEHKVATSSNVSKSENKECPGVVVGNKQEQSRGANMDDSQT